MEKTSKQTANCVKNAQFVLSSLEGHGPQIVEVLKELLLGRAGLEAGQLDAMLGALSALLKEQTGALLEAEKALTAEAADDVRTRGDRDGATAETTAAMVKAKGLIMRVLGRTALREYGMVGDVPAAPADLRDAVDNTLGLMAQNPREVEDEMVGTFSTATVAARLAEVAEPLDPAIAATARETRETQLALAERDRQRRAWRRTYSGVAKVIEGLFELADRADLADRVRPSARKATGAVGPQETTASAAPTATANPQ